jgi:RimJ/RimL family protein N-acetyltransferase
MPSIPVLRTSRLLLRPFTPDDAEDLACAAADVDVARASPDLPCPFTVLAASTWIATHAPAWHAGDALVLAICWHPSSPLVGCIQLRLDPDHDAGELGFWVSRSARNQGVASEAAATLVRFAFGDLGLHRVFASHVADNPQSGSVLRRAGLRHEGTARGATKRDGTYLDRELYGALPEDM